MNPAPTSEGRRLAAIMFTDTVDYTASTQSDEAGTLELLQQQQTLIRSLLAPHRGREIKSTGDGFLVEFDSALKATQCAVEIQRRIAERNAEGALAPIQIRIGIHLGDVVERGTDILGDAVNIAARIEPVAEPGGICVSGAVREQVWNKIPHKLEKLPPTVLKGLQGSMDIYRVVMPSTPRDVAASRSGTTRLAVLPFTNISPDSNDAYFADGLTEELITVLSHLKELRVIARTSVMPYKSTSKGVSQIGAELGVDAILEGSVRKSGDDLRITVQLVNVDTEEHAWAATYDRKLEKVFAVQAEIAKQVAGALEIRLRAAEEARIDRRMVVRPDSYLAYLKGRTLLFGDTSKASLEAAKGQFELAISLDPRNAAAHSGLADATRMMGWWHPDIPRSKSDEVARKLVARAIELDPNLAEAHASLGLALWDESRYPAAEKELKLALSLNPSYSLAHNMYGNLLQDENRPDEALFELGLAEEADPRWTLNLVHLASLLIWVGRLDEAFAKIQRIHELSPDGSSYHLALGEYWLSRGDMEQATREMRVVVAEQPDPRIKGLMWAGLYALTGEKEKAREALRHDETLPEIPPTAQAIAAIYSELGDLDGCFRWLDKAVESHSIAFQRWRLSPRLEHVRKDPRFRAILQKMNLA
jgi:adenylate cyclase